MKTKRIQIKVGELTIRSFERYLHLLETSNVKLPLFTPDCHPDDARDVKDLLKVVVETWRSG